MPTSKPRKIKNPHDGSSLDDFLREEGIHEEVEAAALKRALALKLADLMEKKSVKKTAMAKDMRTSRAALDRLLDPANTSVTLATLNRAAKALGRKVKIELVPA
ncbi:MAG: helix-turn-helix domain-containing protein [Verrucomicrobiaceae bacterium]